MVSADQPALDPKQVARAHRAVEPLHSHLYFAPEHDEHLSAVGLRPGRMAYFAGRAAAMGAVGAGVVTATFGNFSPSLVAHMIPRAWGMAGPEQALQQQARHRDAGRERQAEVAAHGVAKEHQVLTPERLIQAPLGTHTVDLIGLDRARRQHIQRIAGGQPQHQEGERHHRPQDDGEPE